MTPEPTSSPPHERDTAGLSQPLLLAASLLIVLLVLVRVALGA